MRHISTDDLWSKVKTLHSKSVGHTQKSPLDTTSNEQEIDVAKIEPTLTDEPNPENPRSNQSPVATRENQI